MREIGVRALKSSLSETLRTVAGGEQVRVTVRGHPIADIVPASASAEDDRLSDLVARGRLTPAARARPKQAPRLVQARRSASSFVLSEREAER